MRIPVLLSPYAVFALAVSVCAACVFGCAASAREALAPRSSALDPALIDHVLRKAPLGPDENLHAEPLLSSQEFSMYLLQYRVGEQRHIHRVHDLTWILQRGDAYVFIDGRRSTARPGDVFHIPRGAPHYCVNRGDEPLVAVLVFTPPYDPKDSIPLPVSEHSYERDEAAQ